MVLIRAMAWLLWFCRTTILPAAAHQICTPLSAP
jgi:hypothetical protein